MAGSSNLRPIKRFDANTVFSGFVTAYIYNNKFRNFLEEGDVILTCLLAGMPTSLWPSSVKATVEGVVLIPIDQERGQGVPYLGWNRLTFCVLNDLRVVSFHDCDTRVCGPEIDSNNTIKWVISKD